MSQPVAPCLYQLERTLVIPKGPLDSGPSRSGDPQLAAETTAYLLDGLVIPISTAADFDFKSSNWQLVEEVIAKLNSPLEPIIRRKINMRPRHHPNPLLLERFIEIAWTPLTVSSSSVRNSRNTP